jgi:hypothetical protein
MSQRYHFLTDCVSSDGPSITAMVEQARDVTWRTFARRCDWRPIAARLNYPCGRGGRLRLSNDFAVVVSSIPLSRAALLLLPLVGYRVRVRHTGGLQTLVTLLDADGPAITTMPIAPDRHPWPTRCGAGVDLAGRFPARARSLGAADRKRSRSSASLRPSGCGRPCPPSAFDAHRESPGP